MATEPIPTYRISATEPADMFAPEGGGGDPPVEPTEPTHWVISDGGDPAAYWHDGSQEWVMSVDAASLYDDEGKAAETLPEEPPTATWVDRASIV